MVCTENWLGAESNLELLSSLVDEEVQQGYLEVLPSLREAEKRWDKVAVGKLNIVQADSKKPRLVIDPSISGTNGACIISERCQLPSVDSIRHSFPLSGTRRPVVAFSIDVKAARKTIRIREKDRGIMGLRVRDTFMFYRVCPFGASFSAFWFSRLGGFFPRTFHRLLWALYVDDFFGFQEASIAEASLSVLLATCVVFGIPLSWHKIQLHSCVTWIGWSINLRGGFISIPQEKLDKLHALIVEMLKGRKVERKALYSVTGMLQWLLRLFPSSRPWLRDLYLDMQRPPATQFCMEPGNVGYLCLLPFAGPSRYFGCLGQGHTLGSQAHQHWTPAGPDY